MYNIGCDYNLAEPYRWIREYLEDSKNHYRGYYCRGACVGKREERKVVIAVVEAIPVHSCRNVIERGYDYDHASLFSEMWSYEKLVEELSQMEQGRLPWGPCSFQSKDSQQWRKEQLPLKNIFMSSAGYMLCTEFSDKAYMSGDILAKAGLPYYPNTEEAVKDFIDLVQYHGASDARNGNLIFLFPEVRAYFSDIQVDGDDVELHVDGMLVDDTELLVSGAWWADDGIHHFEEEASGGKVSLTVPQDANKLEYILMDRMNTIYDFQSEDGGNHMGLGRWLRTSADNEWVQLVAEAVGHGEGEMYEFKPFVEPLDKKKKGGSLHKSKFYEILKTVSAFSNNAGGTIFIGINDECEIVGVRTGLEKWKKADADIAVINEYSTAIKTGIRDCAIGVHDLSVEHVDVNGDVVVMVCVGENPNKDTYLKDEQVLYYRRGSNNTKLKPYEWRNLMCTKTSDDSLNFL